jgi:hypothetical protein
MAFTEISSQKKYIKYSECSAGDELVEGWYLNATEGKYGTQYNFITEQGTHVVLNKAGQLDYLIKTHVSPEDYVKIIFEGTVVLEKGPMKGKEANNFKLLRDPSRSGKRNAPIYEEIAAPAPSTSDEEPLL